MQGEPKEPPHPKTLTFIDLIISFCARKQFKNYYLLIQKNFLDIEKIQQEIHQ